MFSQLEHFCPFKVDPYEKEAYFKSSYFYLILFLLLIIIIIIIIIIILLPFSQCYHFINVKKFTSGDKLQNTLQIRKSLGFIETLHKH